jgi:hypothetical protein
VPFTVPTLPSAALSLRVNDPRSSGNLLPLRLVSTRAAGLLIEETSLGNCSTTEGAIGAAVPLQPERVSDREITVTMRRTVANA